MYEKYTSRYEGVYTAEIGVELSERLTEIEEIIAKEGQMQQDYMAGVISLQEFSDFNYQCSLAQAERETVEYLAQKCAYFDASDGFEREIFYDTDINDFLDKLGYNYFILLAILCIALPIFDREFSSHAVGLLLTSREGRTKTAFCKLSLTFLLGVITSALIYAERYIAFLSKHGADFTDKAVSNIMSYPGYGDTSIFGFYLTDALIKSLAWGCGALIICVICILCKNINFSFFISAFALAVPNFSESYIGKGGIFLCGIAAGAPYSAETSVAAVVAVLLLKSVAYSGFGVWLWRRRA